MPTVVIVDGFRVMVNTIDHRPAHVHIVKAGRVVRLDLVGLRKMSGATMREADIERARAIVAAHLDLCRETWRRIHGEP